jgi:hypothetical protein
VIKPVRRAFILGSEARTTETATAGVNAAGSRS